MGEKKEEYLETTLAQMMVCKSPVGIMVENIGSCVGVMLWDPHTGIGGLTEIMQPQAKGTVSAKEVGMYADTGIVELIRRMELQGADRGSLRAKIAGGANMKELAHISEISQSGLKNVLAVKQVLAEQNIPVEGEDVGAYDERTIYFMPTDGSCRVLVADMPIRHI